MATFSMSKHAEVRANQRGITRQMISDLIDWADVDAPVGGGCSVLRVSRERLRDRELRSEVTKADKLASLALIWSDVEAEVVTVLLDHGGAAGRRYRAAA